MTKTATPDLALKLRWYGDKKKWPKGLEDLPALLLEASAALASPPPAVEPVGYIVREALDELRRHKGAWTTIASVVPKHFTGSFVPLYAAPPPSTDLREENERLEAERAEQWRLRREMEASRDMERALAATLSAENAAITERLDGCWLPIEKADREITHQQTFPEIGLTLQNSDRYWVRDADGRVFEASWTEDGKGRDYWWDWEGESPVDPVEFMPHPLSALARGI